MLIGLAGYAQSGKSTAAQFLVQEHGFTRLSFADPVRAVTYRSMPDVRRVVDDVGWEQGKKTHPFVRDRLQDIGEAMRRYVDPDVWVNVLMRRANPACDYVVDDARFENECAAIIAAGGHVIRIDRPGVGPVNQHVSEVALASWEFEHIIMNHGTIADLAEQMRHLVGRLQCR